MNSTIAIIIGALSCTGGTGYLTWRCYGRNPEDQPTQLQQIITQQAPPVITRQPSPVIDRVIKDAIVEMRNSNDSDTEIDIKIHIQKHNEPDNSKKE